MSDYLCHRCDAGMALRDGYEPTAYCDPCTQKIAAELVERIRVCRAEGYRAAVDDVIAEVERWGNEAQILDLRAWAAKREAK